MTPLSSAGQGGAIAVNAIKQTINIAGATIEATGAIELEDLLAVLRKAPMQIVLSTTETVEPGLLPLLRGRNTQPPSRRLRLQFSGAVDARFARPPTASLAPNLQPMSRRRSTAHRAGQGACAQ